MKTFFLYYLFYLKNYLFYGIVLYTLRNLLYYNLYISKYPVLALIFSIILMIFQWYFVDIKHIKNIPGPRIAHNAADAVLPGISLMHQYIYPDFVKKHPKLFENNKKTKRGKIMRFIYNLKI